MSELNENKLRSLIRFMPVARALQIEAQKALDLELYDGMGNMYVKNLNGLMAGVTAIVNDPFLASLADGMADYETDQQKTTAVQLAACQLIAYIEGETGLASSSADKAGHSTNNYVRGNQISGSPGSNNPPTIIIDPGQISKMIGDVPDGVKSMIGKFLESKMTEMMGSGSSSGN